jgi:hypothetical protein
VNTLLALWLLGLKVFLGRSAQEKATEGVLESVTEERENAHQFQNTNRIEDGGCQMTIGASQSAIGNVSRRELCHAIREHSAFLLSPYSV